LEEPLIDRRARTPRRRRTRESIVNSVENVLVVGGGIAGLTAATALAGKGVTCEVVEPSDGPAGAAITLLNRAVDGLEEIGVLDRFLEPRFRSWLMGWTRNLGCDLRVCVMAAGRACVQAARFVLVRALPAGPGR
jgi:hypothetical protein